MTTPPPDWSQIAAAQQDQLDSLIAALEAQHRRLTDLEERLARLESRRPTP
jgi:hypothetical protein